VNDRTDPLEAFIGILGDGREQDIFAWDDDDDLSVKPSQRTVPSLSIAH
jgi:hypothetical protein